MTLEVFLVCLCWVGASFFSCCTRMVAVMPLVESVSTGWPVTERNLDGLRGKSRRVFRKVLEGWGLHQEVENTGNGRRLQKDKD